MALPGRNHPCPRGAVAASSSTAVSQRSMLKNAARTPLHRERRPGASALWLRIFPTKPPYAAAMVLVTDPNLEVVANESTRSWHPASAGRFIFAGKIESAPRSLRISARGRRRWRGGPPVHAEPLGERRGHLARRERTVIAPWSSLRHGRRGHRDPHLVRARVPARHDRAVDGRVSPAGRQTIGRIRAFWKFA